MPKARDRIIGLRLRDIRERRRFSQAELAVLLSVPVEAVQDWEDGRSELSPVQIERLARALHAAPAALLEMPGARLRRRRPM